MDFTVSYKTCETCRRMSREKVRKHRQASGGAGPGVENVRRRSDSSSVSSSLRMERTYEKKTENETIERKIQKLPDGTENTVESITRTTDTRTITQSVERRLLSTTTSVVTVAQEEMVKEATERWRNVPTSEVAGMCRSLTDYLQNLPCPYPYHTSPSNGQDNGNRNYLEYLCSNSLRQICDNEKESLKTTLTAVENSRKVVSVQVPQYMEPAVFASSVCELFPPHSAMAEMFENMISDYKTFVPFKCFKKHLFSEETEADIVGYQTRKLKTNTTFSGGSQNGRGKTFEFPKCDFDKLFSRFDDQEATRQKLATSKTREELGEPTWTPVDRERLERKFLLKPGLRLRMERSVDILELFYESVQYYYGSPTDGARQATFQPVWELFCDRVCSLFLSLKSVLTPEEVQREMIGASEIVQVETLRSVVERNDSLYFFNQKMCGLSGNHYCDTVTVNLVLGEDSLGKVELDAKFISVRLPCVFDRLCHFFRSKVARDPDWLLVTSRNLLLRHRAQADLKVTKTLGRLLDGVCDVVWPKVEDMFLHVTNAYTRLLESGSDVDPGEVAKIEKYLTHFDRRSLQQMAKVPAEVSQQAQAVLSTLNQA